jgi:hypothetical protein
VASTTRWRSRGHLNDPPARTRVEPLFQSIGPDADSQADSLLQGLVQLHPAAKAAGLLAARARLEETPACCHAPPLSVRHDLPNFAASKGSTYRLVKFAPKKVAPPDSLREFLADRTTAAVTESRSGAWAPESPGVSAY